MTSLELSAHGLELLRDGAVREGVVDVANRALGYIVRRAVALLYREVLLQAYWQIRLRNMPQYQCGCN